MNEQLLLKKTVGFSTSEQKASALSPGQAIRKFCLRCVGSAHEVETCGGDKLLDGGICNFFKYRLGRGRPSVKTIRKECLFCMNGSSGLISECVSVECPVHPFRLGTNPNFSKKYRGRRPFSAQI